MAGKNSLVLPTLADHICQHTAQTSKPQKPKKPSIKAQKQSHLRGAWGENTKKRTKNPHHNLARVTQPLNPLWPPKPPAITHFLLPADAASALRENNIQKYIFNLSY